MSELKWPEVRHDAFLNVKAASSRAATDGPADEKAVAFDRTVEGVLRVVFRGAPIAEVYSIMVRLGSTADARDMLAESYKVMGPYLNQSLQVLDDSGEATDTVRKKPGSSTGFAVSAGKYGPLGSISKQEHLDLFVAGDYVEGLLQSLVAGGVQVLDPSSNIVRASLKLDSYKFSKIHGGENELGSRLIYSSCWVRNTMLRGIFGKVSPGTVQAGMSLEGVETLRPMDRGGVIETPSGLRLKLIVINAQPLSGMVGTRFLKWAASGMSSGVCDGVVAVAGDSVYAVFRGKVDAGVREHRARIVAGMMVDSGRKEWVEAGEDAITEHLIESIGQGLIAEGPADTQPAVFEDADWGAPENDAPPKKATPYDLDERTLKFMRDEPLQVFVSDTSRSDLVISSPARFFADLVTLSVGACPRSCKSQITSFVHNAMRDLVRPLIAFPGARALCRADILCSGSYFHDILTMLVSSTAALLTAPARKDLTLEAWCKALSRILPQKISPEEEYQADSSSDGYWGGWRLLGLKFDLFSEVEMASLKFHGSLFMPGGCEEPLLYPSLDNNRLLTLLCKSRSTQTEDACDTRLQRTILFLILGGFLCRPLREVGLASLQSQRGAELPGAILDMVIEEYSLASFTSTEEVQTVKDSVKGSRIAWI